MYICACIYIYIYIYIRFIEIFVPPYIIYIRMYNRIVILNVSNQYLELCIIISL